MRNIVSKKVKAICLFVLLGGSLLSAQSRVIANVPFDFVVKNHRLPAGAYNITVDVGRSNVLIRGEDGGSAIFVMTHGTQSKTAADNAKLVFKRYGDRYFLSQVWPASTDQGRQLLPSKAEQEFAKTDKPEIVALLISPTKTPKVTR